MKNIAKIFLVNYFKGVLIMPLLDSFTVDHTIMNAPAVRIAKTMATPSKDLKLLKKVF